MPLPPVVIELSPRDAAAEHATALVQACSEAVRDGDCEVADPEPRSDARAVAIVSSNEEYTKVRIELGARHGGQTRWAVRTLDFGPEDPALERSRTVGFVIGTLVGEAERNAEQSSAPVAAFERGPEQRAKPPAAPTAAGGPTPFATIAATLDSGLERGPPRWGVAGSLGTVVQRPWEVHIGGAYAVRARDDRGLSLRWITVELGAGITHPLTPDWSVNATAAPFAERLIAGIDGPRSDSGGRWVFGLAGRTALHFRLTPRVSLSAALAVAVRESGTGISQDGQDLGRQPAVSVGGALGTRIGLF